MYYIGIDVGGTNLAAGLVDEQGRVLEKLSRPVDKTMNGEQLCGALVRLALDLAQKAGVEREEISAVGAGFPGQVDNGSGVVLCTHNMAFDHTPFRELFHREWKVPVYLGNDADCAALGEYKAGAAKDCDPALAVTLGTGIGGGLIWGGRLFTGFAGSGMEVGHFPVEADGLECTCGNRGCWERYASATALIRMTREEMAGCPDSVLWQLCGGEADRVEGRTPFQAAKLGDPAAGRVLEKYLRYLSLGLVTLVNILQPEIICLGGGVSGADEELLLKPLQKLVDAGTYDKEHPVRLIRAALGNDAGIVGAAFLCGAV